MLHVYAICGEDLVIADSPEVALNLWAETIGEHADGYSVERDVALVPDEREIPVNFGEECVFRGVPVAGTERKTAREWADLSGIPDYLAGPNG